jgi:hypothetical protein
MNKVIDTVKLHFKWDLYQVPDNDDEELGVHNDRTSLGSSKGEEESSSGDLDTEEEPRHPRFRRSHLKYGLKFRKEELTLTTADMKPQDLV